MIEIKNVTKNFGVTKVLDDITMKLEQGKIYGLVGRNGSGKTVLMKHICGFIIPTEGYIEVDGKRLWRDIEMPENLGVIIENPGFLPDYSGVKNLKYLASFRRKISKDEIREAIIKVGLDPDSKKLVGKYSLGMRQRLGLAQAIMEDPDILLLDEPMNGLDNEGVEEIRRILLEIKKRGKLLVIASHSNEDIDCLCDEVFYLDHGKMIRHEVRELSDL